MASEHSRLEMTKGVKCEAHKFYGMYKYSLHHLPQFFPEAYKRCDVLQGDGGVGTIRHWKYVHPGKTEVLTANDKVIPKRKGCSVKWITEYEKGHAGATDPHHYMEFFDKLIDKIDAHICANA